MKDKNKGVRRKIEKFVTEHDVPLLRLLYYTHWLRWGLFCMLCILVIVPVGLLKVWRVTPEAVNPVIKISLLDLVQSWSLHRAALRAVDEGKFDDSMHAWHSSIANNPGNQEYLREFFQFLEEHDLRRSKAREAIQNGMWFLKVTQTNQMDLEIMTDVFDFYSLYEINRQILNQQKDQLTPPMENKLLKSLFHMGDISGFREAMDRLDPARLDESFELKLYQAAYLSMWGPADKTL